jgi:outer membrane protein W
VVLGLALIVLVAVRGAGGQSPFEAPASSPSTDAAAAEQAEVTGPPARVRNRRFEITPMGGYRIESDMIAASGSPYERTEFENAATYGFAVDYALTDLLVAEVQYSYTSLTGTVVAADPGTPNLVFPMTTNDVLFSGLYSFPTSGGRFRPFFGIGVGFTVLDQGPILGSTTRWAVSFSGGLRAYLSDRIGLRLQARWIPAYLYLLPGGSYYCSEFGCYWARSRRFLQQFDFQGGVIFRF